MLDRIRARRDEIHALARRSRAEKVWVFGSCARQQERPDSDVDFLVAFNDKASLRDWSHLHLGLEEMLGRKVDVINYGSLEKSPYFAYDVRKDMLPV